MESKHTLNGIARGIYVAILRKRAKARFGYSSQTIGAIGIMRPFKNDCIFK